MDWLNVAFLRMDKLLGRNAVLIEFFDIARVNSTARCPTCRAGTRATATTDCARSASTRPATRSGATPTWPHGGRRRWACAIPVVLDPEFEVWRLYGNQGWPGRYLFDLRGYLRYIHYGEGDYVGTEAAIAELLAEIDDGSTAPEPLEPMRPEDAPGAMLEPQTADVALPADRERLELSGDWSDGEDWIEAGARRARRRRLHVHGRRRLGGAVGRGRAGALRDRTGR